jgi:hypothetical protein
MWVVVANEGSDKDFEEPTEDIISSHVGYVPVVSVKAPDT